MRNIDKIYINGSFVTPRGSETADLHNPSTEEKIGTVSLGGIEDAREAVAAAKRAFPAFSRTTKAERIEMLKGLNAAVAARVSDLTEAMALEYGAPQTFTRFAIPHAASSFLTMADVLKDYDFERQMGRARVVMQPSASPLPSPVEQQYRLHHLEARNRHRRRHDHRHQAQRDERYTDADPHRVPS